MTNYFIVFIPGTLKSSKVCLLDELTFEFLVDNGLDLKIWDCRPMGIYEDAVELSELRFDNEHDLEFIADVWNCIRSNVLDDPVKWVETLEIMEEMKIRHLSTKDSTVLPYFELHILDVQLNWTVGQKGILYLDLVIYFEQMEDGGVSSMNIIHAAIIDLGPPKEDSYIEGHPTCLCFLGEHAHTKLTPLVLSNVTKMCYRKIKANQVQEKIWKEVVIVTDLTDQGVRITDQAYTKTTLIDPENLVAAGLNDLPDKPGKLIAIKDAFTIFVTDKVSGVEKPIFKYVVDYEDYEGSLRFSKTVCLMLTSTMETLRTQHEFSLIWECDVLTHYKDDMRFLDIVTLPLDDPSLISETWTRIQRVVLDDPAAWKDLSDKLKEFRDIGEL
ncbi:hypothetical protein Fcan01_27894 [Folsomia candida]|uniref:Uncharacterized protein n=1 Tax=Folsomia candida TaxID=158441 RepID=A0A226CWH0_FOLCA|nr:hypothetical protein Fcan01_27894 [Folsomia candida]